MAQRDKEAWLNFDFWGDGRVEDQMVRDDRWWANHHAKLDFTRISYASQCTIPNMACTCPDLECNMANMRSSQPNLAHGTHDFSYSLIYSSSFSSSSTVTLFLIHNWIIIAEYKVMSSFSISPWHDHELTPSTSIHQAQHTLITAYTEGCSSSLYSHNYKLNHGCSISFRHASLYNWLPSASSPWELKCTVALSHSHHCKADWWIESQQLACPPSTASKSLSNLTQLRTPKSTALLSTLRPPSASPNPLDHDLGVHP